MSGDFAQILAAIAVPVCGLIGVWLTMRQGRRATDLSGEQSDREWIVETARELLQPIREELARVNAARVADVEACNRRITELSDTVDKLTNWRTRAADYIRQLVRMMRAEGLSPPEPPDDLQLDEHHPPAT